MKKISIIFLTLIALIGPYSNASTTLKSEKFSFIDYDTAEKSSSFLRFESESTKMGIIKTKFNGFAKNYSISYLLQKNILAQAIIKIDAKSFDTNSEGRNKKMNELCLESEKFPEITGKIEDKIDLNIAEQETNMVFELLGKTKKLKAKIFSESKEGQYHIKIQTAFSLSEWEIPDPSIFIAKVRDQFDLTFEVNLK